MSQPENQANLTEEEATRYDRQMRLWGIEAQQRYGIFVCDLEKESSRVMQNEECFDSGGEAKRPSYRSY